MTIGLLATVSQAGPARHPHAAPARSRLHIAAPRRAAGPVSDPGAQGLLRLMLQAENTLTLEGTQVTIVFRDAQEVSSEQHVIRNGSRAIRWKYLAPPRMAGQFIIDNGRIYWHYIPATNTLQASPSRIQRLRTHVSQVIRQIQKGDLRVQGLGQDTIAGHACSIIQVGPQGGYSAASRRFWVDPTNGAQLKIEEYDAKGQRRSSSYYTDVTYSPVLDKHTFAAPKTPANVRVVAPEMANAVSDIGQAQLQAGFPIQQPSYLPTGFRFQSASVSNYRGSKMVALRYVNGLNALSLFEIPTRRPATNKAAVSYPRRDVVMTEQNGVRLIMVGNLGKDEMQKVITSVH